MPHVVWSKESLEDLRRLFDFLAQFSPGAAARAIETIEEGVEAMRTQPESGRVTAPGQRQWQFGFGKGAYLVRYEYAGSVVTIAAVRHSREQGFKPATTIE